MKEKVIAIVDNALMGAAYNLYRVNIKFGKMDKVQLSKEYGKSGQTCEELIQRHIDGYEEMKKCLAWVKGCPEC